MVFSATGVTPSPDWSQPWDSVDRYDAVDDGVVVAKDSEAVTIAILDNDLRDTIHKNPYDGVYASGSESWIEKPLIFRQQILQGLDVTQAANGSTTVLPNGIVAYTPDPGFTGIDRFSYTVIIDGLSSEANVFVNVVDPIVAIQDWFRVDESSQTNVLDVLQNDGANVFPGTEADWHDAPFTIVGVSESDLQASIEISADGKQLVYTPEASAKGKDQFQYTIRDSDGHESQTTVIVQIETVDANSNAPSWPEQIEQMILSSALHQQTRFAGQFTQQRFVHDDYRFRFEPLPAIGFVINDVMRPLRLVTSAQSDVSFAGNSFSTDLAQTSQTDSRSGNDQEQGVAEGNLVQTDGEYLYSVTKVTGVDQAPQYQLVITDVRDPAALLVVSRFTTDTPIHALHKSGNRVLLLSQSNDSVETTVLDVTDPSSPQISYQSTIAGQLNESRIIDDHLYVITDSIHSHRPPEVQTNCYDDDIGCFFETVSQYAQRAATEIRAMLLAQVQTVSSDGEVLATDRSPIIPLVDLSNSQSFQFSTIVSLDLTADHGTPSDVQSFIHQSSNEIYVSSESIYFLSHVNQSTRGEVASRSPANVTTIANPWIDTQTLWLNRNPTTVINKIGFNESGKISFEAKGEVPGHTLNSFSVSEHEGDLRIATHTRNSNQLFVLRQSGAELPVTGSVTDLAQGEQIYSVRFDGDRGYVVTFRMVDPLFVFDLSDASAPKLLGELKISGYSNYLHVIDDNHVLGIGRDANEQGLFQEMQVSLFDVSDPENPILKHRYSFEGGRDLWSPLVEDAWNMGAHQSISYFPDEQTLVLPIYQGNGRNWSWLQGEASANVSMRVLDVDLENGFSELGNVHFDAPFDPSDARSLRIKDVLLSVSPSVVHANPLRDPDQQLDWLDLTDESHTSGLETSINPSEETVPDVSQSALSRQWHNRAEPLDVDNDGTVRLLDLLRVINFIGRHGVISTDQIAADLGSVIDPPVTSANTQQRALTALAVDSVMADVNDDGHVSAKDVLRLINHFTLASDSEAEQPIGARQLAEL